MSWFWSWLHVLEKWRAGIGDSKELTVLMWTLFIIIMGKELHICQSCPDHTSSWSLLGWERLLLWRERSALQLCKDHFHPCSSCSLWCSRAPCASWASGAKITPLCAVSSTLRSSPDPEGSFIVIIMKHSAASRWMPRKKWPTGELGRVS